MPPMPPAALCIDNKMCLFSPANCCAIAVEDAMYKQDEPNAEKVKIKF
jgi:hypothetical protein